MTSNIEKNWWGRNWKWFAPTLVVTSLTVFAGFFALIFLLATGMMKASEPYKMAVATAVQNEVVQSSIGTPIEEGILTTGSINTSGSSGHADLVIPLKGPTGNATVHLIADKKAGNWSFSMLRVRIPGTNGPLNLINQVAQQ